MKPKEVTYCPNLETKRRRDITGTVPHCRNMLYGLNELGIRLLLIHHRQNPTQIMLYGHDERMGGGGHIPECSSDPQKKRDWRNADKMSDHRRF